MKHQNVDVKVINCWMRDEMFQNYMFWKASDDIKEAESNDMKF